MNALQMELAEEDFKALGFPSNNFMYQEPAGSWEELLNGLKYVRPGAGFVPNFQMFKKIDVNGDKEIELYTYMKHLCGPTSEVFQSGLMYSPLKVSDVRWNFEIFLINKKGFPVYRYSPDHLMADIKKDLEKLLQEEVETIEPEEAEEIDATIADDTTKRDDIDDKVSKDGDLDTFEAEEDVIEEMKAKQEEVKTNLDTDEIVPIVN